MSRKNISNLILVTILLVGINTKYQEASAQFIFLGTDLIPQETTIQDDPVKAAFQACKIGDTESLKELLTSGVDINTKDISKYTLLHRAADNGDLNMVKFLVDNGADIYAKNYRNDTPFWTAIGKYVSNDSFRNKDNYIDIIDYFISKGVKCNLHEILNNSIMNAPGGISNGNDIIAKSQAEIVKHFIDKGADINIKDANGITPLQAAFINKSTGYIKLNIEIINLLISKGADTSILDNMDKTKALEYAVSKGDKNLTELLVNHGADISARSEYYNNTPLHRAAYSGSKETVEYLLSKGADLEAKNDSDKTPLSYAIYLHEIRDIPNAKESASFCNRGTFFYWAEDYDRAIEDFTTAIELDPNDNFYYVARARAHLRKGDIINVKKDCEKAIQIDWGAVLSLYNFLDNPGEDIARMIKETILNNFQNIGMVTGNHVGYVGGPGAFYTASLILSDPFDEDLFLNMLKNEKPVARAMGIVCLARENLTKYENDIRSLYNDTESVPYMPIYDVGWSITIGELAKRMIEEPETLDYWSPEVEKHLTEMQSQSNYNNKNNKEAIEFLIEKGASVNTKDNRNDTPLHFAAALEKTDFAAILIKHGAEINVKNFEGKSPLQIATEWGNSKMIELLINNGADTNTKDKQGRTPLQIAKQMKYYGIADLLREHGATE